MTNLFMTFQNCNLIFVTDAQTDGQAQSNMPLQHFSKLGGIKNVNFDNEADDKKACKLNSHEKS